MILILKKIIYSFLFILTLSSILLFIVCFKKIDKRQNDNEIRITFREGINIHEIADLLQLNGIIKKQDFLI